MDIPDCPKYGESAMNAHDIYVSWPNGVIAPLDEIWLTTKEIDDWIDARFGPDNLVNRRAFYDLITVQVKKGENYE